MKYFFCFLLILFVVTGCKQKASVSKQEQIENKLKKAMNEYLQKNAQLGVTFTVKDVTYFAEKDHYYCEFSVNMRTANKDTTGIMTATISNDLSTITRKD